MNKPLIASRRPSTAFPPTRPVLVFDEASLICRRFVARCRADSGEKLEYLPSRAAGGRFLDLPTEALCDAVHLIETDGRVRRGAEAVFCAWKQAPGGGWARWAYAFLPGFAWISEGAYWLVASQRRMLSVLIGWLAGPNEAPSRYRLATTGFLRGLGLAYGFAFLSLAAQWEGLFGAAGIDPIEQASELWTCLVLGTILGSCLVFGWFPGPAAWGAWLCWLGIDTLGGDFLSFPIDRQLLQIGFAAGFLVPWTLTRLSRLREPCGWGLLGLRACFLAALLLPIRSAGTAEWMGLTAIVAGLSLGPRRCRWLAWIGFFTWQAWAIRDGRSDAIQPLAWLLSVLLLDDAGLAWLRLRRPSTEPTADSRESAMVLALQRAVAGIVMSTVIGIKLLDPPRLEQLEARPYFGWSSLSAWSGSAKVDPVCEELRIEGSRQGRSWTEYRVREFLPPSVGSLVVLIPWNSRLGARLREYVDSGAPEPEWLRRTQTALLEASPDVLALFDQDPFPGQAPHYLRMWGYPASNEVALENGHARSDTVRRAFGPVRSLRHAQLTAVGQ